MALLGRDGVHPPVIGDPALPIGGCVLETAVGTIDAGIESQLNEIERGLTDLLSSAP
jgi:flagellar assembly protein FliH